MTNNAPLGSKKDTNDPFETFCCPARGRSVRDVRKGEGQEMTNQAEFYPSSDPFMVSQFKDVRNRPQIRVSVLAAKGLPQRAPGATTNCVVMAKNKKQSMRTTRDASDCQNPFFQDPPQGVLRWVPGDTLLFRVQFKEKSGPMSFMSNNIGDVAQAELRSDQYYPSGLRTWIPLCVNGLPMPGAQLQVEILVSGAERQSCWQRMRNYLRCDLGLIKDMIQHAPSAIIAEWYSILGDPAHDRVKGDMGLLILVPLVTFLFLTWIGWIVRHWNAMAFVAIFVVAFLISLGLVVMGVTSHKHSKTPFFAVGLLMLISVIVGLLACEHGWNESWRQFWWMHTGNELGATAGTPAAARSDTSVISFQSAKDGTAWTSVDATRAAGFRRGSIYCAAPILDPDVALGDIMRVEFWAIGIDCCDDFGSFTCDASRETTGSVGVVMKGGGMPCFGCHEEEFRLAAAKAAGANKMVSAPGALYVRFVSSADSIKNLYLMKTCFSFVWSLILGLVLFGLLGYVTNYKSWGKTGHFPLYNLLGAPKGAHPLHAQEVGGQPKEEEQKDNEFTLVMTPGPNGAFTMAAMKREDENAVNYRTC